MSDNEIPGLRKRMEGGLKTLSQEFTGLRTGRASARPARRRYGGRLRHDDAA